MGRELWADVLKDSEIVFYMDLGYSYSKTRIKNHDLLSTFFKVNAHNINEIIHALEDKFEDCTNIVEWPLCDEEGMICEKISFGESGMFFLNIQNGYCLKNIETHSMNSFFLNYNGQKYIIKGVPNNTIRISKGKPILQ